MNLKIILLIVIHIQLGYQEIINRSQRKCHKLLKEPNFSEDIVAGHIWREFYSGNIITKNCMATEFAKPTPKRKSHYETLMKEYVKDDRDWSKATLLATSGKYEMLMFPEKPAGAFLAIPNLDKDTQLEFVKDNFTPMEFAMKLVAENKFLVMVDCMGGLGHIMAKAGDSVTKKEVREVARELGFGKGYFNCL